MAAKRDSTVNVRMAFGMKEKLRRLADAEMISLSTYIVRIIREHLARLDEKPAGK
jgi:predicted HicB family RNase H-like nuclease